MTPHSLRARSILAALVAILIGVVIVGVGVDVLVGRHLHRSLDRSLRERAVEVAQLSATAPALITSPGSLDAPVGGTQLLTQVLDRRGRIVARSLALGGRILPVGVGARGVIANGRGRYVDAELGTDRLRVYIAPLALSGGAAAGGAVVVAASTHDLNATLGSVHLFVFVAGLVAAVVAAIALAVLMRTALAPLTRLTGAAAEIERTGDARRRLPQPESGDEVGRLAATLNAMLAALERGRERERRFLADASHELRTPLTSLAGNIDFLAHARSLALVCGRPRVWLRSRRNAVGRIAADSSRADSGRIELAGDCQYDQASVEAKRSDVNCACTAVPSGARDGEAGGHHEAPPSSEASRRRSASSRRKKSTWWAYSCWTTPQENSPESSRSASSQISPRVASEAGIPRTM